MKRAERRAQIIGAATRAFAARGYAATGLEDVAAAAGVTRALLYRHFSSKSDLYRAVLARARARLEGLDGVPGLVPAAAADPDGFRVLFRHAVWEAEFSDAVAGLLPTVTFEAVLAWLDVGQPDPDQAADRISRVVAAVAALPVPPT
ncbi:hypothetical protein Lesp02_14400 [Lentzea sp. NBRC 105346]|uniref:TetR family transcriptional regulator n=1 Tax=Lentzea sp. NBRC 105346 TaxID=3032205 RepID=UPI0024A4E6ED|nr:TetR family transcriptional regulator [Lentzea sp. NBRC 105346]GLZ29250.1 hypothetical protein Lesp02_14400 [Lentzea sp. NBRC 105346]